jgi:hypothetical protein
MPAVPKELENLIREALPSTDPRPATLSAQLPVPFAVDLRPGHVPVALLLPVQVEVRRDEVGRQACRVLQGRVQDV